MKPSPFRSLSVVTALCLAIGGCTQVDRQSLILQPDPQDSPRAAVPIQTNKDGAVAPSHAKRQELAQGVLDLLHANISKGRLNYRFNASGEGVALSTAGLAFLATGSTLNSGAYQDSLTAIFNRLKQIMDRQQFQYQPVWGASQSMVFLANLHRNTLPEGRAEIAEYLTKYAQKIMSSQTAEGSWCHTFEDVPNSLGYRGLVATSVMALQGLGLAQREGIDINQAVIDKAVAYIVASSSLKRGQIGYSTRSGQKGIPGPGRTAGGLMALLAVGQDDIPLFVKADGYLRKSLLNSGLGRQPTSTLQGGHASAQMGVAWAAWYAGSTDTYDEFWRNQGAVIAARRLADGGFSPAPSDGKPTSNRSEIGDFANAWHALMLVADSPIIHIGSSDLFKQAMDQSLMTAAEIMENWQGRTVPEELKALVALKDENGAFGKFPKLLPHALKKIVRDRGVDGEQMKNLLQVSGSGRAIYDADEHVLKVTFSTSRALAEGAAKARVSVQPVEGDKSFFKKTFSTTANARNETAHELVIKLGRKAAAPQTIDAEIAWTFGSKRFKEVISIAVE